MKLKLYIALGVLFIVTVGVYAFLNNSDYYAIDIMGTKMNFPIALWIVLPAIFIFLASALHMVFYSMLQYVDKKKLERDMGNVKNIVMSIACDQHTDLKLQHKLLKPVYIFLKNSSIRPINFDVKTNDEDFDHLLMSLQRLHENKEADLSRFKLSKENFLVKQNAKIRLISDKRLADEMIKKYRNDPEIFNASMEVVAKYGDKKRIEKHREFLNKDLILEILKRNDSDENPLSFSIDECVEFAKAGNFKKDDFIALAKILVRQMKPEDIFALFHELKLNFDEASYSWMYASLYFEKYDEVNDLLDSCLLEDYLGFRKYLALRKAQLPTSLDEFI